MLITLIIVSVLLHMDYLKILILVCCVALGTTQIMGHVKIAQMNARYVQARHHAVNV